MPYEKIGKNEPVCIAEEVPFDIPDSWEWCRVGDLFTNLSGLSYKKDNLAIKSVNMVRVLRGGNIGNSTYFFKDDDVFISKEFVKPELFLKKNYMITPAVSSIEHIGKIGLIEQDYDNTVVGGFVLMLIPFFEIEILSKYLLYCFSAKHHRDNCRNITHKSGQAFYNLSREKLMNLPVPLPPLSEQQRIVEKIEELLPLVEEYDKVEKQNTELNISFPDKLKKSILQEAVQGKLVPQDPNDEPASVLIEKIRKEKEQLIKDKKIKKDKNESYIFRRDNSYYEKCGSKEIKIDESLAFEIPLSWEWVRLNFVTEQVHYGYTASATNIGDAKLVRITDIQNNKVDWETVPYCSISQDNLIKYKLKNRDILIARTGGTIGKTYIVENLEEDAVFASYLIRAIPLKNINEKYLKLFMESPLYWEQLKMYSMGTGQPNVNGQSLSKLLLPLPPLEEQQRIVNKVCDLFPFANKLSC